MTVVLYPARHVLPILLFMLKYLPILLAEFLISFGYLFCSIFCWQNLSRPTPDPSLVHYFWEKNVIADDPFTDEIEPSVPFTLGVVVKNAGYGTASSLTLESGQPKMRKDCLSTS